MTHNHHFVFIQQEEGTSIQVIPKEKFESALREVFALKSDENVEALMTAAIEDLAPEEGVETLTYQDLFMEVKLEL